MDTVQTEPTLEESLKQVYQTLPPAIREYVGRESYTSAAKTLSSKYGLRVDQSGILEREILLMLLGVEAPEEVIVSLTQEGRVPEDVVRNIMSDINQQIFVPLRNEMMRGAAPAAAAPAPRPAAPAMPAQPRGAPPPTPQPIVRPTPPPPPIASVPSYQPPAPPRPVFNQSPVAPAPSGLRAALQSVAPKEAMVPAAPVMAQPSAPKPPMPAAPPAEHHVAPLPPKVILPGARPQVSLRPASTAPAAVPMAPAPFAPAAQTAPTLPSAPRPGHPLNLLAREPEGDTPLTRDASRPPLRPIEVVPARPVPPPAPAQGASNFGAPAPQAPAPAAPYPVDPYREPID